MICIAPYYGEAPLLRRSDNEGITQFYLPSTHEPYPPLLPSHKASPPFGWYSLRLPTIGWPGWVDLGGWSHTEINVPHYSKALESYCITAQECMHLIRNGHFPSCDKAGSNTNGSAMPKAHAACKSHGAIFYTTGVTGDGSLHCENRDFFYLFAPVTLTWWPSYTNYKLYLYFWEIHQVCKFLLLRYGFRKDRLTDI